jgi:hypothetical protein
MKVIIYNLVRNSGINQTRGSAEVFKMAECIISQNNIGNNSVHPLGQKGKLFQ